MKFSEPRTFLSNAFLSLPFLAGCSAVDSSVSEKEAALVVSFAQPSEFRSPDGSGNNQTHSEWGAHGDLLIRLGAPRYADGASEPAGLERPNVRDVSNAVVAQSESVLNSSGATDMFWLWGQFLDHDITIVEIDGEPLPISVPSGDAFFDPNNTGSAEIPFNRSRFETVDGVRQHPNEITAFIDASNVYGSTAAEASFLRANDGTGRLRTSEGDLLPLQNGFFVAGDVRANEHIFLTAMHTLWMREHNYWADFFRASSLSADTSYEMARLMVSAEMQAITYNEFLPLLVGPRAIGDYSGYDPSVNPGLAQEFSVAAYRLGHSMLNSELQRLNADGTSIAAGPLLLRNAFFNPSELTASGGITPLLRGMAGQQAQEIDELIVDDVRNFLFGQPGQGGFDLASLNLQRGRDHGLPTLAEARSDLGLPPIESFGDISSDPQVQAKLASVYEAATDVDLWVGGLAEDSVPGSQLGVTFQAIVVNQFTRLRDGDRFFYQQLPDNMRLIAENTKLSTVIRRNTDASIFDMQHEVMRLVPDAANETLGFESSAAWNVDSGSASRNDSYRSDGSASLDIHGTNVQVTSANSISASALVGERLKVDVFVPDDIPQAQYAGIVEAVLKCPAAGIHEHQFPQFQLPGFPRGQFNTASFELSAQLKDQLSNEPEAGCYVTIRVMNNGASTPFALDRLRAE